MAVSQKGLPSVFGGSANVYQVYIDQMFNWSTASTALTQMNAGVSSSAAGYSPLADGFLIGIEIQISGQAASSLAQSGYATFTSTMWAPVNTLTVAFTGFGLLTAPQVIGGAFEREPWENLWLPVKTSVPIVGKILFQYSPVTPNVQVMGKFAAANPTATKA